ncbi:MAG: PAS domain-containing protein [Mariniphaga sp.]|nr:PAS domain-containing protein [Mariniphaga sp.]
MNSKKFLEEPERLELENRLLQQQLRAARESIEVINNKHIDALVIADEKDLKVYIEKTADKSYRILIEKMHEGAVILNDDKTILYCNPYFANIVKLPLQKVIGTKFDNYVDAASKEHIETLRIRDNEIVTALKEEIYIYASDGVKVPVLMTLNSMFLDDIFVFSIILTDLTIQNQNQDKLKRRTNQLEQINKELDISNKELIFQISEKEKRGVELNNAKTEVKELVGLNTHKDNVMATLSHDLRSPLAGIIGLAELLKDEFETLEHNTIKDMLNLLFKASKDELSMLNELVEWARIKYASEAFSPTKIELSEYVKRVFNTLNEIAVANKIQLYNITEKDISVYADENMLLSILQNIVSNSIKHTLAGGKITVSTKIKEDKIVIEVKDSGIGMSKEIKDQLFTPQLTILSNARKENKGAGIGLLLVKGFVEKNGGEIWVESVEGAGSSFYFTLPAMKYA